MPLSRGHFDHYIGVGSGFPSGVQQSDNGSILNDHFAYPFEDQQTLPRYVSVEFKRRTDVEFPDYFKYDPEGVFILELQVIDSIQKMVDRREQSLGNIFYPFGVLYANTNPDGAPWFLSNGHMMWDSTLGRYSVYNGGHTGWMLWYQRSVIGFSDSPFSDPWEWDFVFNQVRYASSQYVTSTDLHEFESGPVLQGVRRYNPFRRCVWDYVATSWKDVGGDRFTPLGVFGETDRELSYPNYYETHLEMTSKVITKPFFGGRVKPELLS
jgi:hypothetical protein